MAGVIARSEMDVFKELERLRQAHRYCDDCWYSCPKNPDGCCDYLAGNECNCGADEHNTVLDKVIEYLRHNKAIHTDGEKPALTWPDGEEFDYIP